MLKRRMSRKSGNRFSVKPISADWSANVFSCADMNCGDHGQPGRATLLKLTLRSPLVIFQRKSS